MSGWLSGLSTASTAISNAAGTYYSLRNQRSQVKAEEAARRWERERQAYERSRQIAADQRADARERYEIDRQRRLDAMDQAREERAIKMEERQSQIDALTAVADRMNAPSAAPSVTPTAYPVMYSDFRPPVEDEDDGSSIAILLILGLLLMSKS